MIQVKGTQFVSNPFQVLGVSDADTTADTQPQTTPDLPDIPAPQTPAAPEVPAAHAAIKEALSQASAQMKASSPVPSSPHTTWLHNFGLFLLDTVLPDAAEIALPILLKRL